MTARRALARDLTPRLVRRQAPAPVAVPAAVTPAAVPVKAKAAPPTARLGVLFPPREQRPGQPPVYAVGRLCRQDGSRGVLIHVVALDATTLEVRHRLREPDGPCVIVGTLRNGAGLLNLNADDTPPYEQWAVIRPRKSHEGWKLIAAERKRATA